MPTTKQAAAPQLTISEDEIRQRAYFLWEADGRPEGDGAVYWHRAHHEAMESLVGRISDGVAAASGHHNPQEGMPVAAPAKAPKSRAKDAKATTAKPAPKPKPAKTKPGEDKPAKKATTKPRAAIPSGS